ncbi:MAG: 3-oxoacid CoA-transferase subunit B [Synergistes jonesii]|uniref:3-oxoacid CoA-transferase subunit B n=1 Tax=Synergistes jonesii TaxID=2754 RepID=UPI002A7566B9|nr:3-oxoacid CoA-transferase subunit B [Synergistes jonesii]MDY2984988.1 3-oxoacid CoA-transferase subunit B [Synergistes jonesii]
MFTFTEEDAKARIAKYIAEEFDEMSCGRDLFINLGVGIPTMVADYITSKRVFLQAENGMLGVGPVADEAHIDPLLINASRVKVTETKGCSYMNSADSFGMIRGGHVDATVIGAFEVDEEGNVANWIIPNGKMLGVGGAMDLVSGAKKVYIAMQHLSKKGKSKIVKKCALPITGYGAADVIVTEYAVFKFKNGQMVLTAKAKEISFDELKSITEAKYVLAQNIIDISD